MKINEYLNKISPKNIDEILPGVNGPYNDQELRVRNISHWLIVYSHLYEKNNEKQYYRLANRAADYLCSKETRPMNATYWCRNNPKKDKCNGVMGQAWVLEGLLSAKKYIHRDDCYNLAVELINLHPFDEYKCIWNRVNVDGSYYTPDSTFNHQLWFAAIAASIDESQINKRVIKFFNKVASKVEIYNNGVIYHASQLGEFDVFKTTTTEKVKQVQKLFQSRKNKKNLYSKSVGYHGFNLYAFSLLKTNFHDHAFWDSDKWHKIISVINTSKFLEDLDKSRYGWPYNPPGIELAFACETFLQDQKKAQQWIDRQVKRTYCNETGNILTKNVPDVHTSSARNYELVRLKGDYEISIIDE